MPAKNKREQQAEKRTGDRDDDFVERGNLRQFRAIDVGVSPSIMSIGASCGSVTNPPNGIVPANTGRR